MTMENGGIKVASKTDQVLNYLRGLIDQGELKPGDQIMPEHKLGKQLNVSVITIRRGLEQLVREGLVYKVRGKGNFVAEKPDDIQLTSIDNCTVNLVYPGTESISEKSNVFLGPLIDGLNFSLGEKDVRLRLMPIPPKRALSWMLSDKGCREMLVGGIVLVNYNPTANDLQALKDFGAPVVIIGHVDSELKPDTIDVDHFQGGRKIADHFVNKHNLKKMLFITRDLTQRPHVLNVIEGIKSVYNASGYDHHDLFSYLQIPEKLSPRDIITHLELAWETIEQQDAVIFHGDELALPVLNTVMKKQIAVPSQLALGAYDNFTIVSEYSSPSITAVGFSAAELGSRAAKRMIQLKTGEEKEKAEELVQTKLIVRESCGCNI